MDGVLLEGLKLWI